MDIGGVVVGRDRKMEFWPMTGIPAFVPDVNGTSGCACGCQSE